MSNTFDVNILVNGSRCKQYQHDGKTFIEAKHGSEYVIEIKNNYWKRIEAVAAVDGLNVLNGKTASETDTGYIVDSYHTEKIKGFRFSDDEWALFKFGYKFMGQTYAQSKEDGSEKNCGVIGVRLYYEYEPAIQYIVNSSNWYPQTMWWHSSPMWVSGISNTMTGGCYMSNVQYGCGISNSSTRKYSCNIENVIQSINEKKVSSKITAQNFQPTFEGAKPRGFDMGTEWGKREKSKVTSVSFSRGYLAHSLDIYYASRESLIEMGVPITNQLKVNLPQSFPGKYATPPSGWQG